MENPVHSLIHLSGPHRGSTHVLDGTTVGIGTNPEADVHFPSSRQPEVAYRHARLRRAEDGWLLESSGDAALFVNGGRTAASRLTPGDVIELGRGGPLLRYHRSDQPPGGYKSLREALTDCLDCARYGGRTLPESAGILARGMPRELLTQTAPWTRGAVFGALALLMVAVGYLFVESRQLHRRLDAEQSRLRAVAESVRSREADRSIGPADLDSLRRAASRREPTETGGRSLVARASRSVLFIQGSFGYVDAESGETVRVGRGGTGGLGGRPPVGTGVDGPRLERRYTGTGFVVTRGGYVLTNRHIIRPWVQDRVSESLRQLGYEPRLHRLVGYLPGHEDPFELGIVASSDSADLALLECSGATGDVPPLPLAEEPPQPGESVYVLGYPTGIRALLARSAPGFVDAMRRDSSVDFWRVAEELAEAGHISPLATRGIVGQVTATAVVYDAETTQGGSGGPVLDARGRVVAVNRAVMEEFGGSNLGVPVEYGRRLLRRHRGGACGPE